MNKNHLFSVPKAAEFCALSRGTLWKNVKSGELKASMTPGGHFRIHEDDLISFMRKKGISPVAGYHPNHKKILIVDDDPAIRKLLTRFMTDAGYEADVAEDGFQAGVKIGAFRPSLVVLDLYLPGLDGFAVCRNIKNNPDTAAIKVLTITGQDSEDNRKQIFDAGTDGYLPKPIEKRILLDEVGKLLAG